MRRIDQQREVEGQHAEKHRSLMALFSTSKTICAWDGAHGQQFSLQHGNTRVNLHETAARSQWGEHYTWNRVLLFSVFKLITSEFMLSNGESGEESKTSPIKLNDGFQWRSFPWKRSEYVKNCSSFRSSVSGWGKFSTIISIEFTYFHRLNFQHNTAHQTFCYVSCLESRQSEILCEMKFVCLLCL